MIESDELHTEATKGFAGAPWPPDETARQAVLDALGILDDPAAAEQLDDLTWLAASICAAPIALVVLIDRDRQWFASRFGLTDTQAPRELAFCGHTILDDALLEVPDTLLDPRFRNHPQVLAAPQVRFYAGVPLIGPGRARIGTLCVVDPEPRRLDAHQRESLQRLARQVMQRIELHAASREREQMHAVQRAIVAAQSQVIGAQAEPRAGFDELLRNVLTLTRSEYGFFGEVLRKPDNQPYLKTSAITNIAWDDETRAFYDKYAPQGMEFTNLSTLFGAVMSSNDRVIANDPATDPRRGGLPPGHPPLRAFLGLPIRVGDRLVGMVGLANRPGGYDAQMADTLLPLLSTIGNLLHASRLSREREAAHVQLREQANAVFESERRYRTALESLEHVAVQAYGPDARITFWNRASENLYGFSAAEAIGADITQLLLPAEARAGELELMRQIVEDGLMAPASESEVCLRDGRRCTVIAGRVLVEQPGRAPEFFCFDVDISARKKAEADLLRANQALHQRNRELQQFVMVASHDLQEPLRKVQAFGDRLQAELGEQLSVSGLDYLQRMLRATARMRDLIHDLLDYSAIATVAGERQSVDLGATARGVLDDLEFEIAASGAKISLGPLPTLRADPIQMRQMLQNLIGNALKFRVAERSPKIEIGCQIVQASDGPTVAHIRVADNGIGFDDTQREKIFIPFQRLHARDQFSGTGIGLAIVNKIVEQHGGSIQAHGRPGAGAEFIVSLPIDAR